MKNEIIANWRNYFENVDNQNKTYKLFIETAYGCHGSCLGCPIPLEKRKETNPKWELDKLDDILCVFANNLMQWRQNNDLEKIENLAVTIGPAENLIFDNDYLKNLAFIIKKFQKKIDSKNFHLAVSTSGLFKKEKIISKIQTLKEVLNENQLAIAYIINMRQFQKTPQHYYSFAEMLFENLNLVELEINMDSNLSTFKEEQLKNFSNFVNQFPFIQLDFAYAINDGNITRTYLKNNDFYNFIAKIREFSNAKEKKYFSQWHEKMSLEENLDFNFQNHFKNLFDNIIAKSIRLNSLGEWHFAKNILGTLYYDENLHFKPLSIGKNNPFEKTNIDQFKKQLYKFLNDILLKNKTCENCKFKSICVESGFLSYKKFSDFEEHFCSNPAFQIFKRIELSNHYY